MSVSQNAKFTDKTPPSTSNRSDTTENDENSLAENTSQQTLSVRANNGITKWEDEIGFMNKQLEHMTKENEKRTEMLKFAFDKNFGDKIKACIKTSAEMEARAAMFEAIIQTETLIKKPVKETAMRKDNNETDINFSQTGSTSEELMTSPLVVLRPQSDRANAVISTKATNIASDANSSKKFETEQKSTDYMDYNDKKASKKFRESTMTRVGHWSKNAFSFFRPKNAVSGKEGGISRKTPEKAPHLNSSMERNFGKQLQENTKLNSRITKKKTYSHRASTAKVSNVKSQRPKQTIQKYSKQREQQSDKTAKLKKSSKEIEVLKKRAARLTEAKRRMRERNAAKRMKGKESNNVKSNSRAPDSRNNMNASKKTGKKDKVQKESTAKTRKLLDTRDVTTNTVRNFTKRFTKLNDNKKSRTNK